jgi:glycosyltransferase involved in cell wall biosynthesis
VSVERRAGLVSIVLPAFDEELGIERAIAAVCNHLEPRVESFEVVVVDDGSRDRTAQRVQSVSAKDRRVRLLRSDRNHGKGHAVRQGILASRGDVVAFLDVDLSTPIQMLDRVWPILDGGAHVVVGSRRMPGARIEVHQPWIREHLGDVFRRTTRVLLGIPLSDLTCGFKVFRGREGRALFERVTLWDWTFDVEVLVAAIEAGLVVRDVPVIWRDDRDTKVRLARDLPRVMSGLARLFVRKAGKQYRRPLEIEAAASSGT